MKHRTNHCRSAFSLIELLIALVLVGLVITASGTMLLQTYLDEAAYREQNQAQQNARSAIDMMGDDLRGASASLAPPATLGTTPFTFSIYNDSGILTNVSYKVQSYILYRQINTAGWVAVAQDIKKADNSAGIEMSATTKTVSLSVTSSVGSTPTSTVRLVSNVGLRNLL